MNRTGARNFTDLMVVCVLITIDLMAYFIVGSNNLTNLISLIFLGFIPGYLIVELIPVLDKRDQIERFLMSVLISVVIGVVAYTLTFRLLDQTDLSILALGAILLTVVLVPVVLVQRIRMGNRIRENIWTSVFVGAGRGLASMGRGKKAFTLVSASIIVIVLIASIGILSTVNKSTYSEFYILNDQGNAYDLPYNFTVGAQQQVIMGIENHEGRPVQYFVEIWLVNYSMVAGGVQVKHMFAYESLNVTLESVNVNLNNPWVPQYEIPITLNFTTPGNFYLYFMLFKDSPRTLPARPFDPTRDYNTDPDATWRVVESVNNQLLSLRMNVKIMPA